MIRMVVGLGNPPRKYQDPRHNLGYKVLDLLLENFKLKLKAGRGDYHFAATEIDNRDIYLVKPDTYMNDSGLAVLQAVEKFSSEEKKIVNEMLDKACQVVTTALSLGIKESMQKFN